MKAREPGREPAQQPATGCEQKRQTDGKGRVRRGQHHRQAAQQARLKVWDETLAALKKIDPKTLSPDNQVNYAIYRDQVFNLAADVRLRAGVS